MSVDLRTMLVLARTKLGDLQVRKIQEPVLIAAANEGKNELVKIIRQAREDFFEKETTGAIPAVTPPNPSDITLPYDFSELKEILITNDGYQDVGFQFLDQSRPEFRQALIDGGSFNNGQGIFYYDIVNLKTLRLAPGSDMALNYKIIYTTTVPDLYLPTDAPTGIPYEHWDFIVTWMVVEGFRILADPRLDIYLAKLEGQRNNIINSVNARQVREAQFVKGFMEEEFW